VPPTIPAGIRNRLAGDGKSVPASPEVRVSDDGIGSRLLTARTDCEGTRQNVELHTRLIAYRVSRLVSTLPATSTHGNGVPTAGPDWSSANLARKPTPRS
jgi:hypothetical protein